MSDEERKSMISDMATLTTCYFNSFSDFYRKTKSIEQAYRLTHDMYAAMLGNGKNSNNGVFRKRR